MTTQFSTLLTEFLRLHAHDEVARGHLEEPEHTARCAELLGQMDAMVHGPAVTAERVGQSDWKTEPAATASERSSSKVYRTEGAHINRYLVNPEGACPRTQEPAADGLESAIREQIDYAHINKLRMVPRFGTFEGEIGVPVTYLEAAIEGWHSGGPAPAAPSITQQKYSQFTTTVPIGRYPHHDHDTTNDLIEAATELGRRMSKLQPSSTPEKPRAFEARFALPESEGGHQYIVRVQEIVPGKVGAA